METLIESYFDGRDLENLTTEKEEVESEMSLFSDDDEGTMWIEQRKYDGREGESSDSKEEEVEDEMS